MLLWVSLLPDLSFLFVSHNSERPCFGGAFFISSSMQTIKLEYYGGCGFSGWPEKGEYEVKSKGGEFLFQSLSEARIFYDGLNEEKAFWAIEPIPELIDAYSEVIVEVDAFAEACRPLIKYLAENHHPHVKVIVRNTGAELLEGLKTTGEILDYLRD